MKYVIKCEQKVDVGKTCIRGWHDYRDCGKPAKYKDGRTEFVCGVHKRKIEYYMQWEHNVESITKIVEYEK